MQALLSYTGDLIWILGQGHGTYVELALDFETHMGRALPTRTSTTICGLLHARGQVLKSTLDWLQPHLLLGSLLLEKEMWFTKSLVPFGG